MTLTDFLSKQRSVASKYGARRALTFAYREAQTKLSRRQVTGRPSGIHEQRTLLNRALNSDDQVWIFWFDGGRCDHFRELYPGYIDGRMEECWNGGVGYSGDWATRHLQRDMSGMGLFSVAPVRSLRLTDYDGREFFDVAPEIDTGASVEDRLAALGYREKTKDSVIEISPGHCNESVRKHMTDLEGGVIRYLKPHPPFDGFESMTSGSQKTRNTWYALWSGEITHEELEASYVRTYRQAFEAAVELIPELDGEIYITADHGECLGDCGQVFHSRNHDTHDHLCRVPWFAVDGVKG